MNFISKTTWAISGDVIVGFCGRKKELDAISIVLCFKKNVLIFRCNAIPIVFFFTLTNFFRELFSLSCSMLFP